MSKMKVNSRVCCFENGAVWNNDNGQDTIKRMGGYDRVEITGDWVEELRPKYWMDCLCKH
jgi:hypothetical protein